MLSIKAVKSLVVPVLRKRGVKIWIIEVFDI
jgi:hypothetical protein